MSISKLGPNDGVGFSLFIDEKIVNFKLAVFSRKKWSRREELEYGFVSENEALYTRGTYSGGTTGMGVSDWEKFGFPEDVRLITTDLNEIQDLAGKEEERVKRETEDFHLRRREQVEKINELPKFTVVEEANELHPDSDIILERDDYKYEPSHSSRLLGRIRVKRNFRDKQGELQSVDLSMYRYFSEDGKILSKNFISWEDHWFKGSQKEARELLDAIKGRKATIKKQINDIANS